MSADKSDSQPAVSDSVPARLGPPPKQGLYDPRFEKDACGVGFVVDVKGRKSHRILEQAIQVLKNLDHRGACGAEVNTGDGAGVLLQMPHAFNDDVCRKARIALPEAGQYGSGIVFMPRNPGVRRQLEQKFEQVVQSEGLHVLGWRTVTTNNSMLGETARSCEPFMRQVFIGRDPSIADDLAFERRLFVIRKRAYSEIRTSTMPGAEYWYVVSLSARTIVFKGMLLTTQLDQYFPDLHNPLMETALALVHSRFSTNTFPSWDRAHPYRFIAHNGEINTVRGNINWMHAREARIESDLFGDDIRKIRPIVNPNGSDSGMFDNVLELMYLSGRSLPHAVMMMIPEPWSNHEGMDDQKRAFYQYHSSLMEPWDGPASISFTDGKVIGAVLDRNGLRPGRYYVTKDDVVILASEAGVLDVPPANIARKGRLQPGRMFLVDTEQGRIVEDEEVKRSIAGARPYRDWLNEHLIHVDDLPQPPELPQPDPDSLLQRQVAFGYTFEDQRVVIAPMARDGVEAVGSMGADTPLAVLSSKPRMLYDYFKQLFAQVTNPPIDCIREEIITSAETRLGSEGNLLNPQPWDCRRLELKWPILTNEEFARVRRMDLPGLKVGVLPILFRVSRGEKGLVKSMEELRLMARRLIEEEEVNVLILSDRGVNKDFAPIPSLMAVAGLHHYLIREGLRTHASLVLETGDAREVHHFSLLIGYGVSAINPYVAFETIDQMISEGLLTGIDHKAACKNFVKAASKGVIKVASKMGISSLQSYRGAQVFEAIGLRQDVVDEYFSWTASRVGGIGTDVIAQEVLLRHQAAFAQRGAPRHTLPVGGQYQWRAEGEHHLFNPESIHRLQKAVRTGSYATYKSYAELINQQSTQLATLRGLLDFKPGDAIPVDEVESVESIVKRFKTGAMSYGSISKEAHETLAIAMNRIGGKSNTGEGGEDPERFVPLPNGDSRNSAIKQVASGRFGVTSEYLVNARELQIKMAQGAKPGEGGQLPGTKVYPWIAKTRHTTAGVGLISPPPHHDIYSIEDLAQLIFDLKNVNPKAQVSVKLVSEVGVGTVAAGVAKCKSDHVTISGFEGGTGASPLTSIKHAGSPWEIGLAETHQTLVLNGLRKRIAVQVDGALRTGRDVVIGALLGADEFGFATAPLIAAGCIMMRKCHLNTCPVGVATQDPELRKRFNGQPEHVINYFFFIAEEVRQIMASLGFRRMEEMTGRVDLLDTRQAVDHWKAKGLDFSRLFHKVDAKGQPVRHCENQEHDVDQVLDRTLIAEAAPALTGRQPVRIVRTIRNVDRSAGAMLSGQVAKAYGHAGLPDDTIHVRLSGTAGQSFGAFVAHGVTMELEGEGNDYVGKGLSGGRIVIYPPKEATKIVPHESIIVGNTVMYGAIAGECYFSGVAGERFAVRNSGAVAVVEGTGDHGCEYMTGGVVVVIGKTGRNFAAGMSGGIAYVLDEEGNFAERCNMAMVELEHVPEEEELNERLNHQGGDLTGHGRVDVMSDMTRYDSERLHRLIDNHARYTGSTRAREILDNWDQYKTKFRKVMPVEYRRALKELQSQNENRPLAVAGE